MLVSCAVSAFQLWTLHGNSLEKSKLNESEVFCLYVEQEIDTEPGVEE